MSKLILASQADCRCCVRAKQAWSRERVRTFATSMALEMRSCETRREGGQPEARRGEGRPRDEDGRGRAAHLVVLGETDEAEHDPGAGSVGWEGATRTSLRRARSHLVGSPENYSHRCLGP